MNLLSLTGALLTASASVLNHPIKENHQNKMMDVEYKYQTNDVNTIGDLIVGNIYHFHIDNDSIDSFIAINQGMYLFLNFINVNYYNFSDYEFEIDNVFSTSYENLGYLSFYLQIYETNTEIAYHITFNEDNDAFIYLNTNSLDYGAFTLDGDFIFLGAENTSLTQSGLISASSYNELVPSTSHRGNLYTTIYDFFYGIFDTSDTNEFSSTILGQQVNLTSWLAHSVTIILLLLGVFWLILVIRWIFRVFSGLIKV